VEASAQDYGRTVDRANFRPMKFVHLAEIEQIEALLTGSGGFEGFLIAMFGVVARERMMHGFELFARHVMPRFQGTFATMQANREWVVATGGGPMAPRLS
jgi:limonene 1,2-monooxygenase